MSSVDPLEAVFTAIGVAGAAIALTNMLQARRDQMALRVAHRNGAAQLIARAVVIAEGIGIALYSLMVIIGIVSMTDNTDTFRELTQQQQGERVLAILFGIGLLSRSMLNRWVRRKLWSNELLKEE